MSKVESSCRRPIAGQCTTCQGQNASSTILRNPAKRHSVLGQELYCGIGHTFLQGWPLYVSYLLLLEAIPTVGVFLLVVSHPESRLFGLYPVICAAAVAPASSQLYNAARSQHVGSRTFARHRILIPSGKAELISPHSRKKTAEAAA